MAKTVFAALMQIPSAWLNAMQNHVHDGVDADGHAPVIPPPPFRGALVYNVSGASGLQAWASEAYDTSNIHESVTYPSRLTVPAGVTKVRLSFQVYNGSGASGYADMKKNNTVTWIGHTAVETQNGTTKQGHTPIISVVAGDYFEVNSSTSVAADATGQSNWFAMEIIE